MSLEEYNALLRQLQVSTPEKVAQVLEAAPPKRKRRASAYNRRFAAAYKKLKKAKPRSKHSSLMKQAHRMARKK